MYVPTHFAADDEQVSDLLHRHGAADLITPTAQGLIATLLPLLFEPATGGPGALLGHVARNNPHWQQPATGESLVIVRGPDHYVTPSWYASKAEHGRVVPTWNYLTAHVYGELVWHDDPAWLDSLVRRLTDKHEAGREQPWKVDDAPPSFVAGQLRAVVGVEMRITRIEAKSKFSQNRPEADRKGVAAGLLAGGDVDGARAVGRRAPS
ncbi:FMN-binding negative transcriptional regulator [Kineosporia sp. NBRC 101731]|uniref:FMN-binding negative transcriptional regulator n=1 Tax=Kineosporia sp. NBRC 101731 TaxID=3032199 RepID=UPI00331A7E37